MTKKEKLLMSCAAMLMTMAPQTAAAQTYGLRIPGTAAKHLVKQKIKPSVRVAQQREFIRKYPGLCLIKNKLTDAANKQPFATVKHVGTKSLTKTADKKAANSKRTAVRANKPSILSTTDGRELWGNVVYSSLWDDTKLGFYTFDATDPVSPSSLWINDNLAANGGGAVVDGVLHAVNWYSSDGYLFMDYYRFDAETGEALDEQGISDVTLVATETAVAQDGTVYGQFYNSDATGYELGVIDYNTLTRTTIGTLSKWYVAMGITSDNTIYGVASDGNLYKIDSKTAQETLVGATGLTLVYGDDSTYGQSGEIDAKTNTFYWAAIDSEGNSALYTVDLTTGAANLVGAFEGSEQVYALSIPKPAAEDGAPAAIDGMSFDFSDASMTGDVVFTAPTLTFGGSTLTGELSYTILVDGEQAATGTTTAGAEVRQQVTVNGSGSHVFTVTTTNSVGRSPEVKDETFIGYDVPYNVEDLTATADDATGKVTVTWTAPTGTDNGGYMGDITYNVVRYPDEVTVAEGIKETTFSETLSPDELSSYYYGVTPYNGDMAGGESSSAKVIVGPALTLPYDNNFADETSLDFMTVVDSNNDGATWGYHYEQGCAYCVYSSETADDWLITPPLKLEANKEYTISFTASSTIDQFPERLEVKLGEGNDPTKYTTVLLEPTVLDGQKEFSATYIPKKDESAKIGFHSLSDPDMFNLLLKGVHVTVGSELTAPDSVTNFSVTPASEGALNATVKFNLPSKALNGTNLASLTKAEIQRNGEVIATLTDGLTPGTAMSYTDNVEEDGTYTYKVIIYNASGIGRASKTQSAFVGMDIPEAVNSESIKVKDNVTSLALSWDGVKNGKNGGYIDPAKVTYNIYDNLYYDDFYGYEYGTQLGSVTGQTSCNVSYNTNEGDQQLKQVFVQPQNDKGIGTYGSSNEYVVGEAYTLPFAETFTNGGLDNSFWWMNNPGLSMWYTDSEMPSVEGEAGAVVYEGQGDASYIATGKIAPAGAKNLKLYISTKANAGTNATLDIQVQKNDGSVETLKTLEFNTMSLEEGTTTEWQTNAYSLAAYANEPYIMVRFAGNGTGYIVLDDVQVRDVYQHDLSAAISAPAKIKKGESGNVTIDVTNVGDEAASGYTVRLKADGKTVAETTVNETLQPLKSNSVDMTYATSILDDASSVTLTAEVEDASDLYTENNAASTTVKLVASTKLAPESAKVEQTTDGVNMTWVAPQTGVREVTETFDNYETWSTEDFGDWTCYDGDQGYTGAIMSDYQYGNQYQPFAFEVFEPTAIDENLLSIFPEFAPHSGSKYAAAVYSISGDDNYVDADNWLISPVLSGEEQTISFYAHNQGDDNANYPETIELLSSSTGAAPEDFSTVGFATVESGSWEQLSFTVPEGTTHFAIRHTSTEGGFILGIDDVTYIVGATTLKGYNVYRDGQLVATLDANATNYVDTANPGNAAEYAVTAVYADGESAPAKASLVPASIDEIEAMAGGKTFTVFSADGKLMGRDMKTLKGLMPGVYVINGMKVRVK